MTTLSDRLRAIAEGGAARKALFDEFAAAERSLPECLQGIADAIEEEAEALGKPSPVTQVDVDAAAERVEREWTDWAAGVARSMGVDTVGMTWEEVQSTVEAEVESLRDDAATACAESCWTDWASGIAAMLGVNPEMEGWALRNSVETAVMDIVHAALSAAHQNPRMDVPWPQYDDGKPVRLGDNTAGARWTVDHVVVAADGWKLLSSGNKVIARGATGEHVKRIDTIEGIMADLTAMGFDDDRLQELTELVQRAVKVGAAA